MKFEHLNIEIGEPVIPKNQVKFEVKESLERNRRRNRDLL